MKKIIAAVPVIVGLIIGLYFAFKEDQTDKKVHAYNAYIEQVKPLLSKLDVIISELTQIEQLAQTEEEVHQLVDGWITSTSGMQERLEEMTVEGAEMKTMHLHIISVFKMRTAGLNSFKIYCETENEHSLNEAMRLMEESNVHLEAFVKERDKYFLENDMVLEDDQ